MEKLLTIGELAKVADVPTSTVRYYERAKLLRPSTRSRSNYRLYDNAALERLRFIRAAQAIGLTLRDVSKLLRPAPCEKVQGLLQARLEQVERRMWDLRHVQKVLRASLKLCQKHEESGRCAVVEELSASSRRNSP